MFCGPRVHVRAAVARLLRELLNGLLIALGILSAGMGLYGFLLSSNFIDGGVTGVSMLLAKVTPLPLSFWLPVVNLPFVAIGYRHIGRAFAMRSVLAIVGLAVALATIPYLQPKLVKEQEKLKRKIRKIPDLNKRFESQRIFLFGD